MTFVCFVRLAQSIGESCGSEASVGKLKQLLHNAVRRLSQENDGFIIGDA